MIDRSTAGVVAEPDEVEAVLHNLCGYHLAEQDPLYRYSVLTREQALYGALVAAIKRERGRALAELAVGRTLTQVGQMTGLGTRQRVQRLIAIARAADEAAAAVQAASIAFERQLASPPARSPEPSEPGGKAPVPVVGPVVGSAGGHAVAGVAQGSWTAGAVDGSLAAAAAGLMAAGPVQGSWTSATAALGGTAGDPRSWHAAPTDLVGGDATLAEPADREVANASEPGVTGVLEPTLSMPALAAVLQPTKELEPATGFEPARDRPSTDDDIAWWRHERDTGAV